MAATPGAVRVASTTALSAAGRSDVPISGPFQDTVSGTSRGAGLFGMAAGLAVFMLMMIAAVQVMFNLYATTVVTSAAFNAARIVAGYDSAAGRCAATAAAEREFWRELGVYRTSGSATLTWDCANTEAVSLEVQARHPTILPASLSGLTGLGRMNRTVEVRVEAAR